MRLNIPKTSIKIILFISLLFCFNSCSIFYKPFYYRTDASNDSVLKKYINSKYITKRDLTLYDDMGRLSIAAAKPQAILLTSKDYSMTIDESQFPKIGIIPKGTIIKISKLSALKNLLTLGESELIRTYVKLEYCGELIEVCAFDLFIEEATYIRPILTKVEPI